MAEKVSDGVNGLHFRVGDPVSLAKTMSTAVAEEALWENLRSAIPPVHCMAEHTRRLEGIYNSLIEGRKNGSRQGMGEAAIQGVTS
jgi:hypothetical protein